MTGSKRKVRAAHEQLARAREQAEFEQSDRRFGARRKIHKDHVGHLLRGDLPFDLLSELRVVDRLSP